MTLAIEELRDGACRWPLAEFDRNEFLYCGEATRDEACVYCREHAALAYKRHRVGRRFVAAKATQAARQQLIELAAAVV